jgi:lipoprotein-anchoring transpeptidase ErfK/SrfK
LALDERWLDINTQTQILTAYVGKSALFATLISTGKGAGETLTPRGEHRIWVKLESHDMTNVEDPGVLSQYAIEEVPWVMFFKAGYGLHATFWHDAFGQRRSHGCVNLSPLDARFLFGWAGPHKPPGWRAVLPTAEQPGTRVVVR